MNHASQVVCRQASAADIPAMSRIRLDVDENVLSDPGRITEQMYVDYLELLGRGWVAVIDGEIVGFSCANKTDSSIWALFMSQQYERRGVGKQLLDLAVAWLFEQGNAFVSLSTGKDTRADRFYAARGWVAQRSTDNEVFYRLARLEYHGQMDPVFV